MNAEHRQSVEKVFAEPSFGSRAFEIAIGGRDETNIGLQRRRAADSLVPALLEHAQELRLRRRGELAHFVEKQWAASRKLEPTALQLVRTGKGPALVPEQLGLDQGFRQRRTVERDEWPFGSRTGVMDRPCQNLLAGPALAGEQHRRAPGCDLSCVRDRGNELRRPTDDCVEPESLVENASQRGYLSLELLRFGLGGPEPLLVFGEPLVLDRKHERGRDRGADLHVALVVPVLTRRDEEEATAHLLTEQQWHAEQRSVAALDEVPVTPAPGIQLTVSVPDENDLAATETLQDRIILDGRRRRVLGTASTNDANALESLPVGRPDGKAHHVEIDERSNRFAKPLQKIADFEAGSEDRRESRAGFQAFTAAALSVQHHDRLYEGADEVGNLATGRRVPIGIHSRDGAHDDERPADVATGE